MAKIMYSMAGEGRGHATRVSAILDRLPPEHEVILLASDQAWEMLDARLDPADSRVRLLRIPGLRFHYRRGRLNLTRSVLAGLQYLRRLPELVEQIAGHVRRERPDLVITDFEPALPRAARRCDIPYVSLDHQNFLVAGDLRELPWQVRCYAWRMRPVIRAHYAAQQTRIVSSFFRVRLRKAYRRTLQIGPLLRSAVRTAEVSSQEHLLCYLRPCPPPHLLETLRGAGRPVRIYGLGARPSDGRLDFRDFDERRFVQDLASCAAYVGAAGNQTLGETLHLGKPALVMPESRHHEQTINAHFLKRMGAGAWVPLERLRPDHLRDFLEHLDVYGTAARTYRGRMDGTPAAIAAILQALTTPAPGSVGAGRLEEREEDPTPDAIRERETGVRREAVAPRFRFPAAVSGGSDPG